MKKSSSIKLIIIGTALSAVSACGPSNNSSERLHVRSDSTSHYTHGYYGGGFYHFIPYGIYSNGFYSRQGMDSRNIRPASSSYENRVARGGFGRSNYVVGA